MLLSLFLRARDRIATTVRSLIASLWQRAISKKTACLDPASTTSKQTGKKSQSVAVFQGLAPLRTNAVQKHEVNGPPWNTQVVENVFHGTPFGDLHEPDLFFALSGHILEKMAPEPNLNLHSAYSPNFRFSVSDLFFKHQVQPIVVDVPVQ
jgi:hypothetical protein